MTPDEYDALLPILKDAERMVHNFSILGGGVAGSIHEGYTVNAPRVETESGEDSGGSLPPPPPPPPPHSCPEVDWPIAGTITLVCSSNYSCPFTGLIAFIGGTPTFYDGGG